MRKVFRFFPVIMTNFKFHGIGNLRIEMKMKNKYKNKIRNFKIRKKIFNT